jgi:parallel beta-helix repeat protein
MTYINAKTGLPLADKGYNARITAGGTKLEFTVARKWVEVLVKADVIVPPTLPPSGTAVTPATLAAALNNAKGGDTLILGVGTYDIPRSPRFDGQVTLKSVYPGAARVKSMALDGAKGLVFDWIMFDYTALPGAELYEAPFTVSNSQDIGFLRCIYDGDLATGRNVIDNGYATGIGLQVTGCNGITVSDCTFAKWYRGLVIGESVNIAVLNNDVSAIRSDGMNFMQVQKIRIEGNRVHDFAAAPNSNDHSDMIQFWTTNTTAQSTDITIRNNTLDVAKGTWSQSLFMRNELVDQGQATLAEMAYRNVLIENNTISNAHVHGITVGESIGLTVRKNAVIAAEINPALKYNADYLAQYGAQNGIMVPSINMKADSTGSVIDNGFGGAVGRTPNRVSLNEAGEVPKMAASGNTIYSAVSLIPVGVGAAA